MSQLNGLHYCRVLCNTSEKFLDPVRLQQNVKILSNCWKTHQIADVLSCRWENKSDEKQFKDVLSRCKLTKGKKQSMQSEKS